MSEALRAIVSFTDDTKELLVQGPEGVERVEILLRRKEQRPARKKLVQVTPQPLSGPPNYTYRPGTRGRKIEEWLLGLPYHRYVPIPPDLDTPGYVCTVASTLRKRGLGKWLCSGLRGNQPVIQRVARKEVVE